MMFTPRRIFSICAEGSICAVKLPTSGPHANRAASAANRDDEFISLLSSRKLPYWITRHILRAPRPEPNRQPRSCASPRSSGQFGKHDSRILTGFGRRAVRWLESGGSVGSWSQERPARVWVPFLHFPRWFWCTLGLTLLALASYFSQPAARLRRTERLAAAPSVGQQSLNHHNECIQEISLLAGRTEEKT